MPQMIKATCEECQEDSLVAPSAFTACPLPNGRGAYHFTCPKCGMLSRRPLTPAVEDLLKLAPGVKWVYPPAELSEHHDGPMLTHDDLLVFAMELWTASDDEILARAVP